MPLSLELTVYSPHSEENYQVEWVEGKGVNGEFVIMHNHAESFEVVSAAKNLRFKTTDGVIKILEKQDIFIQVKDNSVNIFM